MKKGLDELKEHILRLWQVLSFEKSIYSGVIETLL